MWCKLCLIGSDGMHYECGSSIFGLFIDNTDNLYKEDIMIFNVIMTVNMFTGRK